ncbi:D-glycerate dehydrogenase [Thalassococcus sp. S3]|uniref:2-hydroxyacid dehydrogenase n=1 Tax=Thalassococcus sp. S3 TaxID=2017482 RepID=UPI001023F97D|nr:D-glycerate dehydrogenase [Thalassococcus sp. S3]QBF30934.1 D-glycerate dehydrogenase [Thalassococcus sp. S3]
MRLLITRPMPEEIETRGRSLFNVDMRDANTPLTEEELQRALEDYDLVLPTLGDAFSADVFSTARSRCRLLANFGVGYNHIDVAAADAAGVAVSNTPGAVTDATADIAIMLMLMSARRAAEGERLVRSGQWSGWHPTQMLGLHVTGKALGVVGMGRIGQAIARRAHFGFGMAVHYQSRSAKDLPYPAERHESLQDLAANVDVLAVAVPGGAETHHLIDGSVFSAMRTGAHLINISRGDVVDETALISALERGEIGGAGLDVYEFEPKVPDALIRSDRVTVLPHLGTAALEVRTAMGHMALDNLQAFAAGKPLPNAVTA